MTKKDKLLKILDYLIPCVTITIVITAGLYIYKTKSAYNQAALEYDKIEEIAGISSYPEDVEMVMEPENEMGDTAPRETFLNLNIDFDSLKEINPDVVGWIYIPSLKLSYPVLHGKDNDYYLHHTVEDTPNFAGSIFIDSQCDPYLSGFNTFIYGHNMKNDSMFGSLSELIKTPELIDMSPYIYYYAKDHAYKFKIFATYTTRTNSFTYILSENRDHLSNYINKVQTVNLYENGKEMDLSTTKKIITLSTCSGSNTGKRTIVHAGIVDDYEIVQ